MNSDQKNLNQKANVAYNEKLIALLNCQLPVLTSFYYRLRDKYGERVKNFISKKTPHVY